MISAVRSYATDIDELKGGSHPPQKSTRHLLRTAGNCGIIWVAFSIGGNADGKGKKVGVRV